MTETRGDMLVGRVEAVVGAVLFAGLCCWVMVILAGWYAGAVWDIAEALS